MVNCNDLMEFLDETQALIEKELDDILVSNVQSVTVLLSPREEPLQKGYEISRTLPTSSRCEDDLYSIDDTERDQIIKSIENVIALRLSVLNSLVNTRTYAIGLTTLFNIGAGYYCVGKRCKYHSKKKKWFEQIKSVSAGTCKWVWTNNPC